MQPNFDVQYGPYFLSLGFFLFIFIMGRFSGSALMKYFKPSRLLAYYALSVCLLLPFVSLKLGWVSFVALYGVFLFMSIMFPTIFALSIRSLGAHTKQGASFLALVVGFFVPIPLFAFIAYYAIEGYKIKA